MPHQDHNLMPVSGRQLAAVGAGGDNLPKMFLRSADASKRFWEFFTAHIRNRNTRKAYAVAVAQFSDWCLEHKLTLEEIQPIHVAGYVELPMQTRSKSTVKQHLAGIRMLFDWLVTGQVIPLNPAHVLSAEEMGALLSSIHTSTLIGLRDRALIALMGYTFARVGAAV